MCLLWAVSVRAGEPAWSEVAPGIDFSQIELRADGPAAESPISIYRADLKQWDLVVAHLAKDEDPGGKSARQWAQQHDLVLAINSGMFARDYRTHVGYLAYQGKVINKGKNRYQSVAAFDPVSAELPAFRIFDLDSAGLSIDQIASKYRSLIQNLRLIRNPGENRWRDRGETWSEAALGQDSAGNPLFIFSSTPMTMHQLNQELLTSGIDIVAAQHLEGGPEAQLYLNLPGHQRERLGNYRQPLTEDRTNPAAWPIPGVIGLRRIQPPEGD